MRNTKEYQAHMEFRVASIENSEIQTLVRQVIKDLPGKTWGRESSLKYHPTDERGLGGNLLHTLRVASLVEVLLNTISVTQQSKDITRAAAILHDCCRHGLDASTPYSVKNHPQLVRQFIQEQGIKSPWIDPICTMIETHMGRWGIPPHIPTITPTDILHIADCIATQTFIHIEI